MTQIERKALALVNEVQKVRGHTGSPWNSPAILNEALYRAIEQHEALEAEVERLNAMLTSAMYEAKAMMDEIKRLGGGMRVSLRDLP